MPEKLPRRRSSTELSVPSTPQVFLPADADPRTIAILGAAYVADRAMTVSGEVAQTAVTAAGRVLEASIQTFGECFCAFMDYMKEREITTRVIAQEMAATARVQAWSSAVIAQAEARTEEVRLKASLVLAAIEDRQKQRDAKLEVIQGFMDAYQRWNAMLTTALDKRVEAMSLEERELLQQHIDRLLQRAREMEHAITSVAVTL